MGNKPETLESTAYPAVLSNEAKELWTRHDIFTSRPFNFTHTFFHRNYAINMHSHSFYEINIVLAGLGRHYVQGMSFRAAKGCVFVIPPNIPHGYWQQKDLDVYHLLIDSGFFERYGGELQSFSGFSILFEIEPFLRGRIQEELFIILNENELESIYTSIDRIEQYRDQKLENMVLRNVEILSIIGLLSKITTKQSRQDMSYSSDQYALEILRAMDYIKSHPSENPGIDELTKLTNMSRSNFQRAFKRISGQSMSKYATHCRVERAKKELSGTKKTIANIAQACGFFDSSHFSNTFMKMTGMLPSEFRREEKR